MECQPQRVVSALNEGDTPLAARAGRGDRQAFTALVRRHQDGVFRFLLRMTGSRDEAMDLTQDTFMKAWQALPQWQPQAQFRTWLLQIARNGALDALRRRGVVAFEVLDEDAVIADHGPTPEERLHTRQRFGQLEQALRRLVPEHREVLLLREVEGLSYAQIAATLRIEEGTVKSRIARARSALLAATRRMTGGIGDE